MGEIFLPSEHHPRYHVALKLVKDAVCYRDVQSEVCDLLVTETGRTLITFLSQVFPSKFAVFSLFYKC